MVLNPPHREKGDAKRDVRARREKESRRSKGEDLKEEEKKREWRQEGRKEGMEGDRMKGRQ